MKNMVDIDVVLDSNYPDPHVTIRTKEKTRQVESIIEAIENISAGDFPAIPGFSGDNVTMLSQRDIVRVYTEGRRVMIQTDNESYTANRTLTGIGDMLNPGRFVRISQSEIVNLYKVKCFDINRAGTIGIEFDNGVKSWAARSKVKAIKDLLKGGV